MITSIKFNHTISAFLIAVCLLGIQNVAHADTQNMEKCYGIAKAGQNDCDPDAISCEKSVIDGDPNYWLSVPKGMCEKMVGGMTSMGSLQTGPTGLSTTPSMPPAGATTTTPGMPPAGATTTMPGMPPAGSTTMPPMPPADSSTTTTMPPMPPADSSTTQMPPPSPFDNPSTSPLPPPMPGDDTTTMPAPPAPPSGASPDVGTGAGGTGGY